MTIDDDGLILSSTEYWWQKNPSEEEVVSYVSLMLYHSSGNGYWLSKLANSTAVPNDPL